MNHDVNCVRLLLFLYVESNTYAVGDLENGYLITLD